jgi:hypothetical protein
LLICFYSVCSLLKNVGALFCSVFKEQFQCRFSQKRLYYLTMLATKVSTCFLTLLLAAKSMSRSDVYKYITNK